jgi:hypothetical protein
MQFLTRQFSLAILFLSLPLLFLPKLNLVSVGSETAGLRLDDFVLFGIAIVLMWSHIFLHQKIYKIEAWIFGITLFSFLSFFSNRFLVSTEILTLNAKIFYTVRLFEYFIFFYIGAMASRYIESHLLIRALFFWNLLLMILQKLNLAGAVTVFGYHTDVSTRVQGIASFPSEMGLLLNLIFCYLIFEERNRSRFIHLFSSPEIRLILRKSYLFFMFILFGIFVVFTGNRISIIALIICFFGRLKQEFNFRSIMSFLLLALVIPLTLIGIGLVMAKTASIYERSAGLLSLRNFELAHSVWDAIDLKVDPIGNEVIAIESKYDFSWWMRIHKWVFIVKSFVIHPEVYLQGLGPGVAWSALDGGLLRIIVEYGLIGTGLFYAFFASIYRINPQLKWMMIAFLINMIFFDAYLAYKTMSLLFFAAGDAFERKSQQNNRLSALSSQQIPAIA